MSTKILVFSDSHGKTWAMEQAIKKHGAGVNYIFHLGDGADDLRYIDTAAQILSVAGNCDTYLFTDPTSRELFIDIDGYRFLLAHGHRYFVKNTTDTYEKYARERGADVALFGHTHEIYNNYRDGLYLFNPGSISSPAYGNNSYGIIETSPGGILLSFGEII